MVRSVKQTVVSSNTRYMDCHVGPMGLSAACRSEISMSSVFTSKKLAALSLAGFTTFTLLFQPVSPTQLARAQSSVTLNLVAYSTPQEAYAQIIQAFQRTKAGQAVTIQASYGASGDQSRKVAQGLPADIVAFSLAPDITRLVPKL